MLLRPMGRKLWRPPFTAAGGGGGVWTTVYEWDDSVLGDDSGWNGYTFVCTIPITDFTATGGSRIRLTFEGASTEGFIASAMYVGNGGGGEAFDFGGTPVQVLMSGSGTITVGAAATGIVTDDVAFVKDGTNPFVMSMQFQNGAADNLRRNQTGVHDENSYYKSGVAEASTQNKSGYSANLNSSYIAKIELLI